MKQFIDQLQEQLEEALSQTTTIGNKIDQYYAAMEVVRQFVEQLKEHVLAAEQPFPDRAAEIDYFKHTAPYFYSRLYYYKLLYNLEVYRVAEDKEGFSLYLDKKLEWAKSFLLKYNILHRYSYSRMKFWDKDLFLQTSLGKARGNLFCLGSQKIALVLACQRYRDFLQAEVCIARCLRVIGGLFRIGMEENIEPDRQDQLSFQRLTALIRCQ
ncbi:MAG TPA: RteC domain-containing protein [Puia sp.]|nr:RteC domain-containing protein [Puia sp.]